MGLRKALSYSKKYARPFTRKSKVQSKSYIKTVPPQKIVKFFMGNIKAYEKGSYTFILKIVSKEKVLLRDNALEACRQVINRELEQLLLGAFFFAVRKYPHHILRENKMYSGGSKGERVNTGMKQSYGSAMGRAAFVNSEDVIFEIAFPEKKSIVEIRDILRKIKPKLACSVKIVFERKQ